MNLIIPDLSSLLHSYSRKTPLAKKKKTKTKTKQTNKQTNNTHTHTHTHTHKNKKQHKTKQNKTKQNKKKYRRLILPIFLRCIANLTLLIFIDIGKELPIRFITALNNTM